MRFIALLAALGALLLWPATAAAESPLEYRAAVATTLRAAEAAAVRAPSLTSLADDPWLGAALARLEAITTVLEAGQEVTLDNSGLIAQLRGSPAEGKRAIGALRGLLGALDEGMARGEWKSGTAAKAAVDEVLSRPDFQRPGRNPIVQFFADLGTSLSRWLGKTFPEISLPEWLKVPVGWSLPAMALVLGIGAALFTIVFFVVSWRNASESMARRASLSESGVAEPGDAGTARLAAERAADRGNYRLAIHFLYLWALLHLSAHSRLRGDPSLTNHEQLRSFKGDGQVLELLRGAVGDFDRLWYGHEPCSEAEYRTFRRAIERVVEITA
jgi:hypothetical protein